MKGQVMIKVKKVDFIPGALKSPLPVRFHLSGPLHSGGPQGGPQGLGPLLYLSQ